MANIDNASLLIAITSLTGTGLSALLTFIFNKKRDKEIEVLKSNLWEIKDEKDAKHDYEYEAKKRIYQEFEPLLFQFNELAGNAFRRIVDFSREAKEDKLKKWLSDTSGYYFKNSIYRFFAPLAIFKLMQNELTIFDLNLEPTIKVQYMLIKTLYHTFSDDFKLAKSEPKVEYDPYINSISEIEAENKNVVGIYQGKLDQIVDIFITSEKVKDNIQKHILSYGEFENIYTEILQSGKLQNVINLFTDFHPKTKPILWRIILAQAYIYKTIMFMNEQSAKNESANEKVIITLFKIISLKEHEILFDWRNEIEKKHISFNSVIHDHFTSIKNYFNHNENLNKL